MEKYIARYKTLEYWINAERLSDIKKDERISELTIYTLVTKNNIQSFIDAEKRETLQITWFLSLTAFFSIFLSLLLNTVVFVLIIWLIVSIFFLAILKSDEKTGVTLWTYRRK